MRSQSQLRRIEYLVYGILMLLILLGPTVSTLFHGHDIGDTKFLANDFLHTFKVIVVYIIAFIIHDLFIAPLLVHKHKPWHYILGVVILGVVFMTYQLSFRPDEPGPLSIEQMPPADAGPNASPEEVNDLEPFNDAEYPPQRVQEQITPPIAPPPFRRHDILSVIFFLFSIGTNIGVKFYFRSLVARREIEVLEKEHLKQQLENLKYQLHPHFFMNTLNNIHALVDIDPEKAQESIIDLSKLMRYILYESNHEYVQASREVEFMANYVRLMSLRYNDKLKFTAENSDDGRGIWIPPLIFISFVENAFKHGVSYNKESFIEVGAKRYISDSGEQRLDYTCRNSKQPKKNGNGKKVSEASGVGLTNIKSRLDLMFGDNYTLDITDGEDEFIVKMDIPVYTKDPNAQSEENQIKKTTHNTSKNHHDTLHNY